MEGSPLFRLRGPGSQSVHPPPETSHGRLGRVQGLRALAAVAVMFSHAIGDLASHGGPTLFHYYYVGAAGVDLFFVISGLVMIYSARDIFGVPGGWAKFFGKRLARIAPLYCLATLCYGLMQVCRGRWDAMQPDLLAASLVFWPYADAQGLYQPFYSIGWTLNYEMFFYCVFAAGLTFRFDFGLVLIVGSLVGLVLLGAIITLPQPLHFWAQPVLLDFLLGTAVGVALLRGWRINSRAALALALLAAVLFIGATLAGFNAVPNVPERFPRWIAWGVPCWLAFAAIVLRKGKLVKLHPWLAFLGESSYAIYLLHPLVIIAMRPLAPVMKAVLTRTLGGDTMSGVIHLLLVFLVVMAGSAFIHTKLEVPSMRYFTR